MSNVLKNTFRIGLSCAVVCGIGWTYLALNPAEATKTETPTVVKTESSSIVKDARADIFGMSFADSGPTQKFTEALDKLGHEPPRVYDLNGNEMLFSTRITHKTPQELVREYQQEFVNKRVNSKMHMQTISQLMAMGTSGSNDRLQKMLDAGMRGEILPQKVSKDYMAMGGAIMRLPADEFKGQPLEAFKHDSKMLGQAYKVHIAAYKTCRGDMKLFNKMLLAEQNQPTEIAASAKKINKSATANTSCKSTGGGSCSQEQHDFEQLAQKTAALQKALKAQPDLYNCSAVRNASRSLAKQIMEDGQERIKALRYIEARRDQDSGLTSVTAMWTNSSFKSKNMMVGKYGFPKKARVRGDLPICPGCERTWNFGGNGHENAFTQDMLSTDNSVGMTSDFYMKEMVSKGWRLVDSSKKTHELMQEDNVASNQRYLRFARGERHMTLRVGYNHFSRRTEVFSTRSD